MLVISGICATSMCTEVNFQQALTLRGFIDSLERLITNIAVLANDGQDKVDCHHQLFAPGESLAL